MNAEHRPYVVWRQALESSVANNARVIDRGIDAPEILHGAGHGRPCPGRIGDRMGIGYRYTPGGRDLAHHMLRATADHATAIGGCAEVVDDDARTLLSKQECVGPPQSGTR